MHARYTADQVRLSPVDSNCPCGLLGGCYSIIGPATNMGGRHVCYAASIKAASIFMTIVFLVTTSRQMGRYVFESSNTAAMFRLMMTASTLGRQTVGYHLRWWGHRVADVNFLGGS